MNQYQYIQELGSGSFGNVIQVRSTTNSPQMLAIKQIKLTSLPEKDKQAALNEVRLLASINAPNIISYKHAFYDEKQITLNIVMEYANGGDLAGLISKKRQKTQLFHQNFIWQIAFDILKAINILHENKIIHRDIKPGNIFFVDGVGKLGDLNISKVLDGAFASTQAGTPYYTSPQIWSGDLYDGKCDIWSLGCVLYEMASLKPPFLAKDFPTLNKKISIGFFSPIPEIYSKKLSTIIKKCLVVNPFERPSAGELLKDNVFKFMENKQEGEVNLLKTIRSPMMLQKIANRLIPFKSANKNLQEYNSPAKNNYISPESNNKQLQTPLEKQHHINKYYQCQQQLVKKVVSQEKFTNNLQIKKQQYHVEVGRKKSEYENKYGGNGERLKENKLGGKVSKGVIHKMGWMSPLSDRQKIAVVKEVGEKKCMQEIVFRERRIVSRDQPVAYNPNLRIV